MDDRKNQRVLVVDDDRHFLEATRTMLEEHGYDVVTAQDGSEGLRRAECESPDLIVLDLREHLAALNADDLVFTSPEGSPLQHSNFDGRVWTPALTATGLAGVRARRRGKTS